MHPSNLTPEAAEMISRKTRTAAQEPGATFDCGPVTTSGWYKCTDGRWVKLQWRAGMLDTERVAEDDEERDCVDIIDAAWLVEHRNHGDQPRLHQASIEEALRDRSAA